jgi:hypothetical protein
MAVLDNVRIIPDALQTMWEQLHTLAVQCGLCKG